MTMSVAWIVANTLNRCSARSNNAVRLIRTLSHSVTPSPFPASKRALACVQTNILQAFPLNQTCFMGNAKFSTENSSVDSGSKEHIQSLVNNNDVVVFMKGVPDQPQCGFSNAVVQILRMHGVEYDSHNVLVDEKLRAGIKEFSDWPTIPQIYLKGEFVGGCDIFLQMHQSGDLIEELKGAGIRSALLDKEK